MSEIRAGYVAKNTAREQALSACREALRNSANAVRATHRGEYEKAQSLIDAARALLDRAKGVLASHQDIMHAGFVHDAQKEYAEACITLALISDRPLPTPADLAVEHAAYMNGLGEAVGELRRHLLDVLRSGDIDHCKSTLSAMDEMYAALVTLDYPDAMTGGLRRTADAVRGILERTRGDFTMSAIQRDLEQRLEQLRGA